MMTEQQTAAPEGAFKAGDRVRWHNPPLCEGTVLKNNGGLCKVQWDTGEVRRDTPDKLRPAAAPPLPAPVALVEAVRTYRTALDTWVACRSRGRAPSDWQEVNAARATLDATLDAALSGQTGGAVPAGDLEKLRKLSEAATPGEWTVFCEALMRGVMAPGRCVVAHVDRTSDDPWEHDAAFIVAAVNDARARLAAQSGGSLAGVGDDEAVPEPAFSNGVTHAIEILARVVGCQGWQIRDGSGDRDNDIGDTITGVLTGAGLYDDETGQWARLATPNGSEG